MEWLDILIAIDALFLIILAMLQGGKSSGASGAIMGGNTAVFTNVKERGAEKVLSRITMGLGIALFVMIVCRGIWF